MTSYLSQNTSPRFDNPHQEVMDYLTWSNNLAIFITEKVGTMGFFGLIFVWTLIWLSWNFFAPTKYVFDPPMGFVLWLFISNLIQIFLMPLIMIGQNIQGKHAEARAEHDLEVNIKAEEEIRTILAYLESQNELLLKLVSKKDLK